MGLRAQRTAYLFRLPTALLWLLASIAAGGSVVPARSAPNDLDEVVSRAQYLERKPHGKLFHDGIGQSELLIFHDTETGKEVWSLTRELCVDIAHSDLHRSPWDCSAQVMAFMGNRRFVRPNGQLSDSRWPGWKYVMAADGGEPRKLIVRAPDGELVENLDSKFNLADRRRPRTYYYAHYGELWRVVVGNRYDDNPGEVILRFANDRRKILQDISRDNILLVQDINPNLDPQTKQPEYIPEFHLVDLNREPGTPLFYRHHSIAYAVTGIEGHHVNEEYHLHSLAFGAGHTIVWSYGPMTDVGEYVGFRIDFDADPDLAGPPEATGKQQDEWGQYQSHGATGPDGTRVYFSGPLEGVPGYGGWGLWIRKPDPGVQPIFVAPAQGGHCVWSSNHPDRWFASHSLHWRERIPYWGHIVTGRADGSGFEVLANCHDSRHGWDPTDPKATPPRRSYAQIPRPIDSPDATKVWFHSDMLMPDTEGGDVGIFILVARRPDPPVTLQLLSEAGTGKVRLRWQPAPVSSEVRGYRLYRSSAPDGLWQELTTEPIADVEFEDSGITPGNTYRYAVTSEEWSGLESDTTSPVLEVAVTGDGVAAKPATGLEAGVTGWDTTAPEPPREFRVTREAPGQYRLTWRPRDGASDLRYFNVYFSSEGPPAIEQRRRVVSPLARCDEYLDWSAPPEGAAFYAITAVDRQGNESQPTYAQPAAP